jgi:hypothetical protein
MLEDHARSGIRSGLDLSGLPCGLSAFAPAIASISTRLD